MLTDVPFVRSGCRFVWELSQLEQVTLHPAGMRINLMGTHLGAAGNLSPIVKKARNNY